MAVLVAGSVTRAQAPAPTLSVTTRLVVLDVVVLDHHGQPVRGIDRSQFAVLEDKVPQTIRSFEDPSVHALPGKDHVLVDGSADLQKIGNAPVNVLVLDELNTKFADLAAARDRMLEYLRKQPEVLPVPTELLAASAKHFSVICDYTQRRDALIRALQVHTPEYSWKVITGAGAGDGDAYERLSQTLGMLAQIADSSRGTPGRKNVIWVGQGYPSVDMTSASVSDRATLEAGIRSVVTKMLVARVTLNIVDPSGVDTPQNADMDDIDADEPLGMVDDTLAFTNFAAATGGQAFSGRNDLDQEIRQGVADGGVYYTLSYVPTNKSDDPAVLRHVHVVMKNPSLHAITREGYYGGETAVVDPVPQKGEKQGQQFLFDMVSAATTTLVYDGLHVSAAATAQGYDVKVPAKQLQMIAQADGSQLAEVAIVGVCFNSKGVAINQHGMELKERVLPQGESGPELLVSFPFVFHRAPGTARVRLVVRDASSGALGSANMP